MVDESKNSSKDHPLVELVKLKRHAIISGADKRVIQKIQSSISELTENLMDKKRRELEVESIKKTEAKKRERLKLLH